MCIRDRVITAVLKGEVRWLRHFVNLRDKTVPLSKPLFKKKTKQETPIIGAIITKDVFVLSGLP